MAGNSKNQEVTFHRGDRFEIPTQKPPHAWVGIRNAENKLLDIPSSVLLVLCAYGFLIIDSPSGGHHFDPTTPMSSQEFEGKLQALLLPRIPEGLRLEIVMS